MMNAPSQPPAPCVRTVHVIENEKELYEEYRKVLRETSQITISIDKIPEEQRPQIENAVQELLTAEVIRPAHDDLRAHGVSEEYLEESNLRSSLDDLHLPESDRRILEAKIRLLSRQTMTQRILERDRQIDDGPPPEQPRYPRPGHCQEMETSSDRMCICMTTAIPGEMLSLYGYNPSTLPPTHTIGLFLGDDDMALCTVEPGAPFGVGPTQISIGLKTRAFWAKEIVAWHLCRGRLNSVFQARANSTATFMLLQEGCDGAHTIVFRKPGFAGIWIDVCHLESRAFWPCFRGKRLTFDWLTG